MTRLIESRTWLVITLLLGSLIGCAGSVRQESTGEYLDDSTITTRVKSAFVADKQVDALDIKVVTFKGTVQLSGFADSQQEIDRADQLARDVGGVKSVKNDIRHKPESNGEYLDDSIITAKVKSAFVGDKQVSALDIKVETVKGVVLLSGFADSQQEIDRAVQLVRNVKSVKSVMNNIELKQSAKQGS